MTLGGKADGAGEYCPVGKEGSQSTVLGRSVVRGRTSKEDDFAKVSKLTGGNLSLDVEIPRVVRVIGGKQFSVGGESVCIPIEVLPDEEINEGAAAQWVSGKRRVQVSKSQFGNMKTGWYVRSRYGDGVLSKILSSRVVSCLKYGCMSARETDMTLKHEAIHAAFDTRYSYLNGDDEDVNAQYHFLSEMLAYIGGDGLDPEAAAEKLLKNSPQIYDARIGAMAEKFLKGEFRFHEPDEIVKTKANKGKDALRGDGLSEVALSEKKVGDPTAKVGIRGWCACLEKQETSGARSIIVGSPWECLEDPTKSMPRYSYRFCLRCGKCRRPDLNSDFSSSRRIFDNQLEIQLAATNGLRTCDYVNARKDVERKFINIPDGQIVFPGKCSCKEPDPIRDGFMNNYVCVRCGLCYVPVNNTVPIGPTAREEWGLK